MHQGENNGQRKEGVEVIVDKRSFARNGVAAYAENPEQYKGS